MNSTIGEAQNYQNDEILVRTVRNWIMGERTSADFFFLYDNSELVLLLFFSFFDLFPHSRRMWISKGMRLFSTTNLANSPLQFWFCCAELFYLQRLQWPQNSMSCTLVELLLQDAPRETVQSSVVCWGLPAHLILQYKRGQWHWVYGLPCFSRICGIREILLQKARMRMRNDPNWWYQDLTGA